MAWLGVPAYAQRQLPYLDGGHDSAFAQLDFADLYMSQEVWQASTSASGKIKDQGLSDTGTISALDIAAPGKAVFQFNRALNLLKSQQSKEAIRHLQRAVDIYPQFVSAHIAMGLAYSDQKDIEHAKQEFETAAKLDDAFPGPFLNLGILALSGNDFAGAESNLAKAASLSLKDPKILTALAYAENGNHRYAETLRTAERVHAMRHEGLASIHYIAAAAAMSLNERARAEGELNTFLAEDSANPLAPVAQQRLAALKSSGNPQKPKLALPIRMTQTFPDSEHLEAQLKAVANAPDTDADTCEACEVPPEALTISAKPPLQASSFVSWNKVFTIHQTVDETALFFAVSDHGHTVNDLSLSDIQIHDDNQPPDKILQFIPQSKLPLRLGLLIDTSDSVSSRFAFEKRAAERFLKKVINSSSDLAFVAGFNENVQVTQDFTGDTESLTNGIESMQRGGETSIFDAVYYASWKLAAYPEQGRVARVLVVLTDGEDNSSHRSLQQAIEEAQAAGVTIYTLSTTDTGFSETDANNILRVLADRSGGECVFPGNLRALDKYLSKLPEVIRSRYLIAYRPANFAPDGKYRNVHVTATREGKRFKVHVRKGYYARLAANRIDVAQR
jgi:Ca-activated chloride channel homolog